MGTDTFTYAATDGSLDSKPVTVTIKVLAPNHAPVARDASFLVQRDGSVRIDFDCLVDDPDGDALSLARRVEMA